MGGQLTCVKDFAYKGSHYRVEHSRTRKYGPLHCAVLVSAFNLYFQEAKKYDVRNLIPLHKISLLNG